MTTKSPANRRLKLKPWYYYQHDRGNPSHRPQAQ
jgi:hypothetical protein